MSTVFLTISFLVRLKFLRFSTVSLVYRLSNDPIMLDLERLCDAILMFLF